MPQGIKNFQLDIICPLELQNLGFFLQVWQDDRKTPTFSRAERTLYSSSIACKKDNHSQSCLYMERDFRDSRSLLLAGVAQAARKGRKG